MDKELVKSEKEKLAQIRVEICDARKVLADQLPITDLFGKNYAPMVNAIEAIDRALILF